MKKQQSVKTYDLQDLRAGGWNAKREWRQHVWRQRLNDAKEVRAALYVTTGVIVTHHLGKGMIAKFWNVACQLHDGCVVCDDLALRRGEYATLTSRMRMIKQVLAGKKTEYGGKLWKRRMG